MGEQADAEKAHMLAAEPLSAAIEAEIDAAVEYAKTHAAPPAVGAVEYLPGPRLLLLILKDGRRLPLPVEEVEEIAHATDAQLAHFNIEGDGFAVHFPDFDGNLDVPFLARGGRGGPKWTQMLADRYGHTDPVAA